MIFYMEYCLVIFFNWGSNLQKFMMNIHSLKNQLKDKDYVTHTLENSFFVWYALLLEFFHKIIIRIFLL